MRNMPAFIDHIRKQLQMRQVLFIIFVAVFIATLANHKSQRSHLLDNKMQTFREKQEFVETSDLHLRKGESTDQSETMIEDSQI